jgi:hypothetical protein
MTEPPTTPSIVTLTVPAGTLEIVPAWAEHGQLPVATVCPDVLLTEALMVVTP